MTNDTFSYHTDNMNNMTNSALESPADDYAASRRILAAVRSLGPMVDGYWCWLHNGLTSLNEHLTAPDFPGGTNVDREPLSESDICLMRRANIIARDSYPLIFEHPRHDGDNELAQYLASKLVEAIEEGKEKGTAGLLIEPLRSLLSMAERLLDGIDMTDVLAKHPDLDRVTAALKSLHGREKDIKPLRKCFEDAEAFFEMVDDRTKRVATDIEPVISRMVTNPGEPALARQLAPALRRLSRRHLQLVAFIHAGLMELLDSVDKNELRERIESSSVMTETEKTNFFQQYENGRLICDILKRDAESWEFNVGYQEIPVQAGPLADLFATKGPNFPPLRVLGILIQGAEAVHGRECSALPEAARFLRLPVRVCAALMYARVIFGSVLAVPYALPSVSKLDIAPEMFWRRLSMSLSRFDIGVLGMNMARLIIEFEWLCRAPKTEAAFLKKMLFVMPTDYQRMADIMFTLRNAARFFLSHPQEIADFCIDDGTKSDGMNAEDARRAMDRLEEKIRGVLEEWQGVEGTKLRFAFYTIGKAASTLLEISDNQRSDLDALMTTTTDYSLSDNRWAEKVMKDITVHYTASTSTAWLSDTDEEPEMEAGLKGRLSTALAGWWNDEDEDD